MRNSGYRVIALTAAIGAAAAVLALTTHRDSATDVAPAPVAPVAPAGTGVADPSSTPATTAGAAMSGGVSSWPAGSIVITGSNGDGVTVLDPTGAARQDIHETDPVTVLVPAAGTAHTGRIQLADQTTGQVSTLAPAGGTTAQATIGGSPIRGAAAGDRTPREGHTIWLGAASGSAVILDPTGAVQSVVKVGSNPAQVIIAPAGTPRAGTAYVLSQGNGEVEKGLVTVIPPTGQPQQITTAVNPTAMAIAPPGTPAAGTIYVAGTGDGTLTIIDPTDDAPPS